MRDSEKELEHTYELPCVAPEAKLSEAVKVLMLHNIIITPFERDDRGKYTLAKRHWLGKDLKKGDPINIILPVSLDRNYHNGERFKQICQHLASILPEGSIVKIVVNDSPQRYNLYLRDLVAQKNKSGLPEKPLHQRKFDFKALELETLMRSEDEAEKEKLEVIERGAKNYLDEAKMAGQKWFHDDYTQAGVYHLQREGITVIFDAVSRFSERKNFQEYLDKIKAMKTTAKNSDFGTAFLSVKTLFHNKVFADHKESTSDALPAIAFRVSEKFIKEECAQLLMMCEEIHTAQKDPNNKPNHEQTDPLKQHNYQNLFYPFGKPDKHPQKEMFIQLIQSVKDIDFNYGRIKVTSKVLKKVPAPKAPKGNGANANSNTVPQLPRDGALQKCSMFAHNERRGTYPPCNINSRGQNFRRSSDPTQRTEANTLELMRERNVMQKLKYQAEIGQYRAEAGLASLRLKEIDAILHNTCVNLGNYMQDTSTSNGMIKIK